MTLFSVDLNTLFSSGVTLSLTLFWSSAWQKSASRTAIKVNLVWMVVEVTFTFESSYLFVVNSKSKVNDVDQLNVSIIY